MSVSRVLFAVISLSCPNMRLRLDRIRYVLDVITWVKARVNSVIRFSCLGFYVVKFYSIVYSYNLSSSQFPVSV